LVNLSKAAAESFEKLVLPKYNGNGENDAVKKALLAEFSYV
jgi:hypothetical protein